MTKTPPEQTKDVTNHSLHAFVSEVVELAQDGWHLDEDNLPAIFGFTYVAHMWRNPTEEQRNAQPKLSRGEQLALARAAKAAKRQAAIAAGETPPADTEEESTDDSPY